MFFKKAFTHVAQTTCRKRLGLKASDQAILLDFELNQVPSRKKTSRELDTDGVVIGSV